MTVITVANDHTTLSVACFAPWLPAELVRAVGGIARPFRPGGRSTRGPEDGGACLCDVGRRTLDALERGDLADVDALIFGSACDVARNLASVVTRRSPALHVDYVHFPENVGSDAAVDWFELELERVLRGLALLAGEQATDADVEEAILAYDRVRAAIERLEAVRRDEPWRLSTVALDRAVSAALEARAESAEAALREERIRALERPVSPRACVRVLALGGSCARPSRELLEAIEESGVAIVEDDFNPGLGLLGRAVGVGPERPLRRIARAFIRRSRARLPRGGPEPVVRRARDVGAAAVLLLAPRSCEPVLLDGVLLARALEKEDIPCLRIEHDDGSEDLGRVRSEVTRFVESPRRRGWPPCPAAS